MRAKTVLVAEDDWLMGHDLAELLRGRSYQVLGPFESVAEAMPHVSAPELDAAILDVRLRDQPVFPIAGLLEERGIPFIFVSGNPQDVAMPSGHYGRPFLVKPVRPAILLETVAEAIALGLRLPHAARPGRPGRQGSGAGSGASVRR